MIEAAVIVVLGADREEAAKLTRAPEDLIALCLHRTGSVEGLLGLQEGKLQIGIAGEKAITDERKNVGILVIGTDRLERI